LSCSVRRVDEEVPMGELRQIERRPLLELAEQLLQEPEIVEWLGGDPPPTPFEQDDDDPPRAA
jgi:hypothetical protein